MGDTRATETDGSDYAQKNRMLYERQKALLDTFLEHGAISRQQHDKSLSDLTEKMHFQRETPEAGGGDR